MRCYRQFASSAKSCHSATRSKCRFLTLHNLFADQGEALMGRLSASLLTGFELIRRAGPFDFVLRADTDALSAGEFHHAVSRKLKERPQTGMLGTLGHTCRRESPHYGCEATAVSDVVSALEQMPRPSPAFGRISGWLRTAVKMATRVKSIVRAESTPCRPDPGADGDSRVPGISGRLGFAGCSGRRMMGMFTRTTGLECTDFSAEGEPFASNYRGLAYPPRQMLKRKHVLLHSVKSDPNIPKERCAGFQSSPLLKLARGAS